MEKHDHLQPVDKKLDGHDYAGHTTFNLAFIEGFSLDVQRRKQAQ